MFSGTMNGKLTRSIDVKVVVDSEIQTFNRK
jgi:hypothetical protein